MDKLPLVLTVIIMVLPLVWTLTDPRNPKERVKAYFNLRSGFYFLAEVILVLGTLFGSQNFPWPRTSFDSLIITLGLVLFLNGIFIAVWAKVTMKSSWGMPAQHDIKRQNKIIRKGPFSFSRNPIYLGLILVFLGYTLALRSYTILLIPIVIVYFYRAVLKEEKILAKHFGKEYMEYRSKVRRFI